MCEGPQTAIFTDLMQEAYSYSFKKKPRYRYLINQLKQILYYQRYPEDIEFSWNKAFFLEFRSIIKEDEITELAIQNQENDNHSENFEDEDLQDTIYESPNLNHPDLFKLEAKSNILLLQSINFKSQQVVLEYYEERINSKPSHQFENQLFFFGNHQQKKPYIVGSVYSKLNKEYQKQILDKKIIGED